MIVLVAVDALGGTVLVPSPVIPPVTLPLTPNTPVSGGGTLCSVEFVAIAPGRVPLSISEVAVEDLGNERVAYSLLPPSTVAVRE